MVSVFIILHVLFVPGIYLRGNILTEHWKELTSTIDTPTCVGHFNRLLERIKNAKCTMFFNSVLYTCIMNL